MHLFSRHLLARGTIHLSHLFNHNGDLIPWAEASTKFGLHNYFRWLQIINAIPSEWKSLVKNSVINRDNCSLKQHLKGTHWGILQYFIIIQIYMCQILGLLNCARNNINIKGANLRKKTSQLFGTVVFCDCTVIGSDWLANHKKKIMPKKILYLGVRMLLICSCLFCLFLYSLGFYFSDKACCSLKNVMCIFKSGEQFKLYELTSYLAREQ